MTNKNTSLAAYDAPQTKIIIGMKGSATGVAFAIAMTFFGTGSSLVMPSNGPKSYSVNKTYQQTGTVVSPFSIDVRMPWEHLENIKSKFNLNVSELSSYFGVSRPTIYKWMSVDANPEETSVELIRRFSHLADFFSKEEVDNPGYLIKIKAFSGKSLIDHIKNNDQWIDEALVLVNESKLMKHAYDRSGLSSSKAPTSDDWKSSISIPGSTSHD